MAKKRKAKKTKAKRKLLAKKATTSAKRAARYNPHTGRPTGRAKGALERRDALVAKYIAEGMSAPEAKARAMIELRANPRMDWRN